jgi:hypothetical protein
MDVKKPLEFVVNSFLGMKEGRERNPTEAIKEALIQSNDLRRKPWKNSENKLAGHCYIASEILYHLLGGKNSGWKPMFMRVYNTPHWYLQHESGKIIDLTDSQFDGKLDRTNAVGKGFLTKHLSKRATKLLSRTNLY